jgi:predicted aspartyl protease
LVFFTSLRLKGRAMAELKLIIKPDETEAEAAEVYVDGKLDRKVYQFLFDTGAARSSVISDNYTARLNSVGQNSSSGVFTPATDDLITVHSIEIGPIARQNFTLTRSPANAVGKTSLIGMDLLKDYSCHFFFNESRVLVDSGNTHHEDYPFESLFLDQKSHPYVDIQFEGVRAKAVWDTGASITVVDINFINSHPTYFEEVGQSEGTDSTGTTVDTPMFMMSQAVIGKHLFPPHKVAGVDFSQVNATIEVPMDLIVGYSTYRKADWLFDFPHKRWVISKWYGN